MNYYHETDKDLMLMNLFTKKNPIAFKNLNENRTSFSFLNVILHILK